ncbi:MAG: 3-dehydroquinate synthase [Candidatus Magasanikbacteria bacterium RIFOXYC2_FULL_42_28]|uniref:3-dehydroquinate synthase n=1 Tax=Candidatus Magasanikbacteria bacterium RIFOXYC2_FULL_42_28 TaxID=1798704 RepID=A0A1F6NWW1_9BACT|nr:MAG: 3-dehydroquinate synthase [Candidatus Magasanikbacteria bacterium RIFOXYC2_FULL_42_28]
MKKIIVRNLTQNYPIYIGQNLGSQLTAVVKRLTVRGGQVVVIMDNQVQRLFGQKIKNVLSSVKPLFLTFAGGEKNKNQTTVTRLQNELLRRQLGRDTVIVAVGGGVVGDLAGFVAATYLRGVRYVQVPTTLLAMVDSSIGGKVGIDTPYGKNTIGSFYPPQAVIMDLDFLVGLPRPELVNGLMEAIKTFLTSDKRSLSLLSKLNFDNVKNSSVAWQQIISRSAQIKSAIVANDEKEGGERKIINFGHTIGHVLELLSNFKIRHGLAVGYGILAEMEMAHLLKILSKKDLELAIKSLKIGGLDVVNSPFNKFSAKAIVNATKYDKKKEGGVPCYVLLKTIGKVLVKNGRYAHPVPSKIIMEALKIVGC